MVGTAYKRFREGDEKKTAFGRRCGARLASWRVRAEFFSSMTPHVRTGNDSAAAYVRMGQQVPATAAEVRMREPQRPRPSGQFVYRGRVFASCIAGRYAASSFSSDIVFLGLFGSSVPSPFVFNHNTESRCMCAYRRFYHTMSGR